MMKRLAMVLAGISLAACGGNVRMADPVRYDFGALAAGAAAPGSRPPLATVEVQTASWLAGPAMHFRFAYAEPLRRRSYAESRWAAPPGELLEAFLKRRLIFGQSDSGGSGCRLQLVLDELEQRFDDPQQSRVVLEVRALLTSMRGSEILSRRVFLISKPATAADAGAGAAAAREGVQALAGELGVWLDEVGGARPAVVGHCRN